MGAPVQLMLIPVDAQKSKGHPMKKSFLLAALLLASAAQADDTDCINASNLSAINLTSNTSFAEISWKVDVTPELVPLGR